jgi:hypothetical protein
MPKNGKIRQITFWMTYTISVFNHEPPEIGLLVLNIVYLYLSLQGKMNRTQKFLTPMYTFDPPGRFLSSPSLNLPPSSLMKLYRETSRNSA